MPDNLDAMKKAEDLPVLFLPDVREHLAKHLVQAFYKWRGQLGDGLYDGFQSEPRRPRGAVDIGVFSKISAEIIEVERDYCSSGLLVDKTGTNSRVKKFIGLRAAARAARGGRQLTLTRCIKLDQKSQFLLSMMASPQETP